ncbi:MAG: tetratricopeptide repeat protein [candidate division Zixibacteria bacterium]|nr:tetratricopeptide repeat protein [candidate division Zixibacteria bacterium]
MFVEPKVIDYFTNDMILAKVNGDLDTAAARKYAVSGFPTAVMLSPDGKEVDRIVGYAPPDEYLKTLVDYRNGIGTLDDLLNKAKDSTDRTLYYSIADKYKYRGGSDQAADWFGKVIAAGQPTDSLSGESRMAMADLQRRAKKYDDAMASFVAIEKEFTGSMFAEQANIWQAILYRQKGDTASAITAFQKFIELYPKSDDVEYAKKQIDRLKNPPAPAEKKS